MKDFYKILGIDKNASQDEIKKAYKKLALKYHPDRYTGADANERMSEINEAYDTLSDPEKRKQYDNPAANGFSGFGGFDFSNFDFDTMYGQQFNKRGFNMRTEVVKPIAISISQAISGITKRIDKKEFVIPPGVVNGQRYLWREEGMTKVYLEIQIVPSNGFSIKGNELHYSMTIDWFDALLGCKKEIDVFGNLIRFTIPEGTTSGKMYSLKNKGYPIAPNSSERGNLIVTVNVNYARKLKPESIELVKKIQEIENS